MDNLRIRVGGPRYSEKSIGVLVDVVIDENGSFSSSRLEWFPKSLCAVEKIEIEGKLPEYYLTAPRWLVEKKNKTTKPRSDIDQEEIDCPSLDEKLDVFKKNHSI
jgi:hypothetical protein